MANGNDAEVGDYAEARRDAAQAVQMLRDVANGKFAAATKDGTQTFATAPRRQYGPNAFDRIPGAARTT